MDSLKEKNLNAYALKTCLCLENITFKKTSTVIMSYRLQT